MSHNGSHTVRLLSERGSQAARPGPAREALKFSVEDIVQLSHGNEEADTQLQSILRCPITGTACYSVLGIFLSLASLPRQIIPPRWHQESIARGREREKGRPHETRRPRVHSPVACGNGPDPLWEGDHRPAGFLDPP